MVSGIVAWGHKGAISAQEKLGFSVPCMVTARSLGQEGTFSRIRRTGAHSTADVINITDGALLTLSPDFPVCSTTLSYGLTAPAWPA